MQVNSWEELQLAVESGVVSAEQAIGLDKGRYKALNLEMSITNVYYNYVLVCSFLNEIPIA